MNTSTYLPTKRLPIYLNINDYLHITGFIIELSWFRTAIVPNFQTGSSIILLDFLCLVGIGTY